MARTPLMNPKLFKELYRKPKGDSIAIYKRLLTYGRPYWLPFMVAILASACYSAIDSYFVYLLKPLLDKGFVDPNEAFIRWIPIFALGLFLVRAAANVVGSYYMEWVGRHVVMIFRQQIFQKLMQLPCHFYDTSSSGQLLSLIVYNAAQVASTSTDALTKMVQSGVLVIGLLVVMFTISWQLSLTFIIIVPLIALLIKYSAVRLRHLNRYIQGTMAEMTHTAEEAVDGYRIVRTFGGEHYETNKFNDATKRNLRRELKIVLTKELSVSAVELVGVCGLAAMIYMGTSEALQHTLTAGGFAAIMGAMMALFKPMKDLASVNATIQRGLAGAESVFELLDRPVESDPGTLEVPRVRGAIEYRDVNFAYGQGETPTLTAINFTISPGQKVAIVGRSGSGKSTLVSLLPRFYDIQQGTITIDGINIFDFKLSSLREQFSGVSQQVVLFNDTIAHNIAYGKLGEQVSLAEIEQAAIAAHAMEFIKELPDGLQTLVGENGVLLSGGQRQRIAIARAILKDAPILILDEATSALDSESERYIQTALEAVMQHRTTLIIAHRLSTVENADLILVMDAGRVVEVGTHQALLAIDGHYSKLHRMQFKDNFFVAH